MKKMKNLKHRFLNKKIKVHFTDTPITLNVSVKTIVTVTGLIAAYQLGSVGTARATFIQR